MQDFRMEEINRLLAKMPSALTSVTRLAVNTFSLHVSSPVNTPLSHRLRRGIETVRERETAKHECVDLS